MEINGPFFASHLGAMLRQARKTALSIAGKLNIAAVWENSYEIFEIDRLATKLALCPSAFYVSQHAESLKKFDKVVIVNR